MDKKVSIILVNWKQANWTIQCIDNLKKSSYKNFHIVVVDNGSNDGSVTLIKNEHPDVTIIQLDENTGFAYANNVAIEHEIKNEFPDYLFILNNDTYMDKECLRLLVEAIEMSPNIGVVVPKIYYWDHPNRIWFFGAKVRRNRGEVLHIGLRQKDIGQFDKAFDSDYATGCALLIKREVCEKVGSFDLDYFANYEDVDLGLRVVDQGYRIVCIPKALLWHKVSISAGGDSPFYLYYRSRNKLLLIKKQTKGHRSFFDIVSVIWFYFKYLVYHGIIKLNPLGAYAIYMGVRAFFNNVFEKGNPPLLSRDKKLVSLDPKTQS